MAKPLHAGHVRNADIGESLKRILSLKYPNLITQNYWGDWGVQFGILIWGWKRLQEINEFEVTINQVQEKVVLKDFEKNPIDTLVKVYVWANMQKDSFEGWEKLVREEFIKLESGVPENKELWSSFLEISKKYLTKDLELLNVSKFDFEEGESHYEKDIKVLYEVLESENAWKKDGKARYIDLADLPEKWEEIPSELEIKIKNFGRCYLISSDGYTTYPFRDVAARWAWARDHKADKMVTVTGSEQKHNFDQAFSIISFIATLPSFKSINSRETIDKLKWENLIHVQYGFLELPEGKMSSRKGNFLTAKKIMQSILEKSREVLDEKNNRNELEVESNEEKDKKVRAVAIAALKWFDLARDSNTNITLDMQKIFAFEGNTGVYQLYTLARLNSILENSQSIVDKNQFDVSKLNKIELEILRQVYTLPNTLELVCKNYKSHLLCNHLFDLSTKVNSWYVKYSVLKEVDKSRQNTLLLLCEHLKWHLSSSLELLGIDPIDRL